MLCIQQNFISFEYAALNYTNPKKNQYRYQLEGVRPTGCRPVPGAWRVNTDLGPGEYVFRCKGSNNNGIWNEQGASMRIIIHPPWWAHLVGLYQPIRFCLSRVSGRLSLSVRGHYAEKTGYWKKKWPCEPTRFSNRKKRLKPSAITWKTPSTEPEDHPNPTHSAGENGQPGRTDGGYRPRNSEPPQLRQQLLGSESTELVSEAQRGSSDRGDTE